jgi:hypothetical protein
MLVQGIRHLISKKEDLGWLDDLANKD